MAVADVFLHQNEWVKIHVELAREGDHRFYRVFARDEADCIINGFEYRLDAVIDCDPAFVVSIPQIARLVKFAREDIEADHWNQYIGSLKGLENLYRFSNPYDEGRTAFLNKQNPHVCPYPDESDNAFKWIEGWADEYEKNPDAYDDVTELFK
jgi:hypothetical protein